MLGLLTTAFALTLSNQSVLASEPQCNIPPELLDHPERLENEVFSHNTTDPVQILQGQLGATRLEQKIQIEQNDVNTASPFSGSIFSHKVERRITVEDISPDGLKRNHRTGNTAYDSVTKKPLANKFRPIFIPKEQYCKDIEFINSLFDTNSN